MKRTSVVSTDFDNAQNIKSDGVTVTFQTINKHYIIRIQEAYSMWQYVKDRRSEQWRSNSSINSR